MKLQAHLIAAVLLATPAAALAAPGMITAPVNLRAGPSVEFPVVDRIARGVPVEVHGCIREALWCDVSTDRDRGWVAAQYLDYLYGDRYVYLPSYVDLADVPSASFVLGSYWSRFYFGRPWYRRHAWWNRHWNTRTGVASQAPAAPPAQAARGMMPARTTMPPTAAAMTPAGAANAPVGMGRGPHGAPVPANGHGANVQAMRPPEGHMAPGAQNGFAGMRRPMTSGAVGPTNAMRGGGMPMAARAQVGGSRGGPGGGGGPPHAAMGGTPQAGGMHQGGGGMHDNGGGHRRH